ncbi:MAG: hypothetical protein ACRDH5_00045 [bacterium]
MGDLVATILGTSIGGAIGLLWIAGFVLYLGLPLMAFSVMRNIKGIRVELERLNRSADPKAPTARAGPLGL